MFLSPASSKPQVAMDNDLRARLAAHDEYFCRVLDLVPSHLYLPKDESAEKNVKYFKVRD